MAAAYVRDTGRFSGAGVASAAASFGTLPAVGNHVFAQSAAWNATQPTSVTFTDNQSNTWGGRDKQQADPGSGAAGSIVAGGSAKVATSSGTFTVTVATSVGTNNFIEAIASEFSGIASASWFDQSGSAQFSSGTSLTVTAAGANAQASELVFAAGTWNIGSANVGISTPTTGYTQLAVNQDANATIGFEAAYKVVSASETSSASYTWTSTGIGALMIVTYKAAATTGAAPPPRPLLQRLPLLVR